MKRGFLHAVVCAGCLWASGGALAQAAPPQNPPAQSPQKPAAPQPKHSDANAFPEDTTSVPVMPTTQAPVLPDGAYGGEDIGDGAARAKLPVDDSDPVRSPDDARPVSDQAPMELTGSDSRAGLDKVVPGPDDDDSTQGKGKHRRMEVPGPEHQETSKEDIEVGGYYLEAKNWKAARSRFESALVLAPDEPDVYWGLAESERHLGNLAAARGYYQKVAEYDPDSKHGKESIKALKEPEIANAKAAPPAN